MEPAIRAASSVTARAVKPGDYQPADGDVVVVRPAGGLMKGPTICSSGGWSGWGETIECCDGVHGQIKRNGEPYLADKGESNSFPPVKVPAGQTYVMEDHRGTGNDSALHRTLPVDAVVGRIKLG
jgi:hypothetical protein